MLVEDLNQLIISIKVDFYQRLIKGDVERAKESLFFIVGYGYDLQNKWLNEKEKLSSYNNNIIIGIDNAITELCNKISNLNALSKRNLQDLKNQEFADDPETWKILLTEEFEPIVNETLKLINAVKEKFLSIEKEKQIPQQPKVVYLPQYNNKKSKFDKNQQDIINKVEKNIINALMTKKLFARKITDKILSGLWKGKLHAWLPEPLGYYRIVYSYNNKEIIFETIGTKKELKID